MKTWLRALLAASLLVVLSSLPAAADTLEELKGKQIKSERGEILGTIEQVIIGPEQQIQAVTVEKEGFFGLGGEENHIPWVDLKMAEDQSYLIHSAGARQQEQSREAFLARVRDPGKTDDFIGRTLIGSNGENLGTIKMNYLSADQGTLIYLIVQSEENTLHPVPPELVSIDRQGELQAEIDKESFNRSPRYSPDEMLERGRQQWSQDVEGHYGLAPGWQPGVQ